MWADDNKTLFYVENDPETLLTKRVKKHVLGTRSARPIRSSTKRRTTSFYLGVGRTRDDQFI